MPKDEISMIDISEKQSVKRVATATGKIYLARETIEKIKHGEIKKGDPLVVGKIAALNAIKQTPLLIPMCHQIPISHISFDSMIEANYIEIIVKVTTVAQTGVEMEALVGVTTFLNVIWDMVKYLEKDNLGQYPHTSISDIRVLKKEKEI
ncbi:MAG: cyclic pyranopterin monophosphate synthase MoaC [Candidatus Heimdallarchaeaceae archaeon]